MNLEWESEVRVALSWKDKKKEKSKKGVVKNQIAGFIFQISDGFNGQKYDGNKSDFFVGGSNIMVLMHDDKKFVVFKHIAAESK